MRSYNTATEDIEVNMEFGFLTRSVTIKLLVSESDLMNSMKIVKLRNGGLGI